MGGHVVWKVCFATPEGNRAFDITMAEAKLTNVTISEDAPAPDRKTGVIVQIDNVQKDFRAFETAEGHQELAEIFALYMINYRTVSIRIAGDRLDPEKAIASEGKVALPPIASSGEPPITAELHIIEWRADTKRTLYLCSADGFPLDQFETKSHVPGFSFSAYLKSKYVELLHNDDRLGLAEMDPPLAASIERARETIKTYFKDRASERGRSVVEEWKAADVYPYRGEPQSDVERAERQVFDIVAVHVQEIAPEIGIGTDRARAAPAHAPQRHRERAGRTTDHPERGAGPSGAPAEGTRDAAAGNVAYVDNHRGQDGRRQVEVHLCSRVYRLRPRDER